MAEELSISEFRAMFLGLQDESAPTNALLEMLWEQAVYLFGNIITEETAATNPAKSKERKMLLYYILCHLTTLQLQPDGQSGRVQSATEGSVSVSYDLLKANSETAQWWAQTRCGATYWAMTARYRRGGCLYGSSHYHPWG